MSETGGLLDEEDEEERDLGFATAQDEDVLRRKVIVEQSVPMIRCLLML